MLAVIAPGQGAQTPGLLAPWLDLPDATAKLRWWSAVTGLDLVRLGTTADAAEIRDTAVAQPLLVAAGLLSATALDLHDDTLADVYAGHSVGEVTAGTLAGSLTDEAALVFVGARGRAMARSAAAADTGMTAVLGGELPDVLTRLTELGLEAANRNGAGQLVAAGRAESLKALAEQPPAGVRLRPLPVAGAFHTDFMSGARRELDELAAGMPFRDPDAHLLSNADGALVAHGAALRDRLVAQVTASVRWDLCLRTLRDLGVTGVIELAPGGTLTGLVRRELPGVDVVALKTPADLPAARELVHAHLHYVSDSSMPAWRVVVAPAAGTFHPEGTNPGASVDAGTVLGTLRGRRDTSPVTAAYAGVLVEWLVEEGDPVSPGQPLARLHPQAVAW
ncbi:MAG: ACP S-malonyltransferase [Mycobacteriales bacterium]